MAAEQAVKKIKVGTRVPALLRYFSLGGLVVLIVVVIFALLGRRDPDFRMTGFPTSLSEEVVAVVEGYERKETDGEVIKYYIKADRATTFSDNHQELENVFLQVFAEGGQMSDTITAAKSIYVPEDQKNFTAYFAGDVAVQSRDGLIVKTEQITYKRGANLAEAEEAITFERAGIKGSSFGAQVNIGERKIELLRDVVIETDGTSDSAGATISKTTAAYASYDQAKEKIELKGGVNGSFTSAKGAVTETAVAKSSTATIFLTADDANKRDVSKLELNENVSIDVVQAGATNTKITSGYALYDKTHDRYDLRQNAVIDRFSNGVTSTVAGDSILYDQLGSKATVTGNARSSQGTSSVSGNVINAVFYSERTLKSANVVGSAVMNQASDDRTTKVTANELLALFSKTSGLENAKAIGGPVAVVTPAESKEFSKLTMSASNVLEMIFKGEGLIERMQTDGRTTLRIDVPNNAEDATNKVVIADMVRTFFHADGKNLANAEAIGRAELYIEPIRQTAGNYRSITTAPRFDCDFFATGNNAKSCLAGAKTKTIRTPLVASEGRGVQTLTSARVTALFQEGSNALDTLNASGDAKFSELDRNATSDSFIFTSASGVLNLRGGEPTVWNDQARTRATEIDWLTKEQRSSLRGRVSSTYYNQAATGNSTPFTKTNKPVFITSDSAEINHATQTAVYTGNARGWQEENYIRTDRLTIKQKDGQLNADGSVQSLLSQAAAGSKSEPVNASSERMSYNRESRIVRYENSVDIRRGTDRLTGKVANVFLDANNEVSRSEIDGDVVITQPDKRATGEFARYEAAEEVVYLRGNPATIDDSVNGSSKASEFTVYMKTKRVLANSSGKQASPGRIRSVYKVTNK